MEKQTKNVITREFVEQELHFYNTSDIKSTLVLIGALSLFFLPLTILLVYLIIIFVDEIWLKILSIIIVVGIMSAPVWINLLELRKSLEERNLLLRGEFDIVTRPLLYKYEATPKRGPSRRTERFFHFADFKDCIAGSIDYQLDSPDDEFYIVHYRTKDKIKLIYSAKRYEYKEG